MRAFFDLLDSALGGITPGGLLLVGLPFFVLSFMLLGFWADGAQALFQVGVALWVLAIPVAVLKMSRSWREEYRALALALPVVVAVGFVFNAYGSTTRTLGLVTASATPQQRVAGASATSSPRPSVRPSPSATPADSASPTPAPSPSDVVATVSGPVPMHRMDLFTPVSRGGQTKVTVRTIPGVRCAVRADYMSADVNAQTIPPQLVPPSGVVTFQWTVDPSATPGRYTVRSTCSSQTSSSSLALILSIR